MYYILLMSASTTQFTIRIFPYIFVIFLMLLAGCEDYPFNGEPNEKTAGTNQRIHPDFDFRGIQDLNARISPPAELNARNAPYFLSLAGKMLEMPPRILLLITKKHGMLASFMPKTVLDLDDYAQINKTRAGMTISHHILEPLLELFEAARKDGINLAISSAYRPYSLQEEIFAYFTKSKGPEWTSLYSAPPGHSQHQLGTTVDFARPDGTIFTGSPEEAWVRENAGRFGWSLSYPKGKLSKTGYEWESWHWRWIGEDAVKMQNEFFGGMQQNTLVFWFRNSRKLRQARISQ